MGFLFRTGRLHIVSSQTKEIIGSLRANDRVVDFDFLEDGNKMVSLSDSGMFNVWDMRMQQCCHSFSDDVSGFDHHTVIL